VCLILFAWKARADAPLIVAANRDENFARPTDAAEFWADRPAILAGRDLNAGGTWLGVDRNGRFAAITNFRNPADRRENAPSRGALVAGYLWGKTRPGDYLAQLQDAGGAYNGFSLLVGDPDDLWFYSNRGTGPQRVEPGVHGLSNHLLDTPWPKVVKGIGALETRIDSPFIAEDYFSVLSDSRPAPADALPDTGIGAEREKWLSSMRIVGADYGTRSSTVLCVTTGGSAEFHERTWARDGSAAGTVSYEFRIAQT